ncbi:MAG: hypothetical protein HC884_00440 [Chloroflexaceae bacterium]|nr:hypothetical protein [Chloroflexaceae bacterium]
MTTSRLSRVEQPPGEPTEKGVRANTAEATRLYQRGVAAARGGQRRVAAGLLTRSVQLDPNNEGAWLWLSGVIDDPHQIAFCLQSVLKLNPANERARQGLRWLEERQLLKGSPQPAPLLDVKVGEPVTQRKAREHGESWWVNWRQVRRDMRRVGLLLWSVPLILLFLALLLHQTFTIALEQNQPLPPVIPTVPAIAEEPEIPRPLVVSMPTIRPARPTAIPILNAEPAPIRESRTIHYLGQLQTIRQQLRDAVETYRSATGRPGSTTIVHAAAAQNYRTSIEQSHTLLLNMDPPQELSQAHADYVAGLELEMEAIDSMVEFYGGYQVEYANLAALRFQDATALFAQARAAFDTRLEQIQRSSGASSYTVR